jgi:hypothetical protein
MAQDIDSRERISMWTGGLGTLMTPDLQVCFRKWVELVVTLQPIILSSQMISQYFWESKLNPPDV